MRFNVLALLTFCSIVGSQAQDKNHEIGWENGIRYARHHIGPFDLGLKISPRYSYSTGENPSDLSRYFVSSGPYTSNSHSEQNSERRQLLVAIQGSKAYRYFQIVSFEPYAELGYNIAFSEYHSSRYSVSNAYPGTTDTIASWSEGKGVDHAVSLDFGIKPGVIFKNMIKVYMQYGLSFQLSTADGNTENYQETKGASGLRTDYSYRKSGGTSWSAGTFGSSSLTSGVYVSLLF